MRNSKLYSTLKDFEKTEQNRFRKYVRSAYFNKNKPLMTLCELLLSDVNGENGIDLEDRHAVWNALELESSYDDVRFRRFCTDLLKLAEGYMAQRVYEANPIEQSFFLMQALGKRKLEKLYNGALKNTQYLLHKQGHRNADYFRYLYATEKQYAAMIQADLDRSTKSYLERIVDNLDLFYITEKLRLHHKFAARKKIGQYDYSFLFIDEIISEINNREDLREIPVIAVYFQIYLITVDPENTEHYYKLKELLNKHALLFPKEEAFDMYYAATNYCINNINRGAQQFMNELFELYRDLIEKEIIFIDDELSPWDFRNIIVTALRLGEFDWTEKFIDAYNNKIPEEYRENAVSFNKANLFFYRKDFDKVIESLRNVEYEDFTYNLNSKAILLATYYETQEIEPLYSLFESFRVYLNRNKDITEDRKRLYKNLIRFTKKLTKIMPGDQKAIDKLRDELNQTKNVASAGWLAEKLAELE
jgi:hypothetical protein